MKIRQGLTIKGWMFIIHSLNTSKVCKMPTEVKEVVHAMLMLADVESSCPAIKLTLREKEDA